MKRKKRMLAIGTAAILTLTLAACGRQTSPQERTPEELLDRAMELSEEKISSLESNIVTEMGMTVRVGDQLETTEGTITMHMVSFLEPLRLKVEVDVDVSGLGTQSQAVYIQESGDAYEIYSQLSGEWFHTKASLEDVERYTETAGTNLYLESAQLWNYQGDEEIEGRTSARYTGEIRGEKLTDLMEETGVMDSMYGLEQLGISKDNIVGMLRDMDPTAVQLWIDRESCRPVRFEMDMTSMANSLMEMILETVDGMGIPMDGISVNYTKLNMKVDYFSYNEAEDFKLPGEALAAA